MYFQCHYKLFFLDVFYFHQSLVIGIFLVEAEIKYKNKSLREKM